jgi:hypothetical protein
LTEWAESSTSDRLRNQNDLAVGTGLEYLFVSAGGLGERQLLPDDGPEGVVL